MLGKKIVLFVCGICLFVQNNATAQEVGLVFSGGGAKGLAHLGVIKAFEENDIPIDYITGTSMGAIIGSMYAAGYSPEQMEEIVYSEDFQNWVKGKALEVYDFSNVQKLNDPSWISIDVGLDSAFNAIFSPNLSSDLAINFALMELLAPASVKSQENFDNLMIPLRINAADVFTQKQIIIEGAPLHKAARSSMTVPFFFRPVRVGEMLLFDGGLYNNFPVDVMEQQFNPDYIVGVNVAVKKYPEYPYGKNDLRLLNQDLIFMFLDKTDSTEMIGKGLFLEPNLEGYSALDFDKVHALVDSGYNAAIRAMPEIKRNIQKRQTKNEIINKRREFKNGTPPLVIDKVRIKGYNRAQTSYLSKLLSDVSDKQSSIDDVRKAYYQLLANDIFKDIVPDLIYNEQSKAYDFELSGTPNDRVKVDVGGNIGSKRVSSLYFGLRYSSLQKTLNTYGVNLYTGRFYQSVSLSARKTFSPRSLAYVEPIYTYNNWDYLNSTNVVFGRNPVGALDQVDQFFGVNAGIATGNDTRLSSRIGYFNNSDRFNNDLGSARTDSLDRFKMTGFRIGAQQTKNSFNRKQYASKGRKLEYGLDLFAGNETLEPFGAFDAGAPFEEAQRTWIRAAVSMEQYFYEDRKVRFGYMAQWVHSTQPAFFSYVSSLANSPGFYPLQDSRTLFLTRFRAPAFVAGGLRNVYELSKNLDFRLEAYGFVPYRTIAERPNNRAAIETGFSKMQFAGAATMVYHSPVGPIALSYNHYDDPFDQKGLFLHIGYILFNNRSLQ